ncbi:MAG: hypothetical protein ACE5HS_19830 [bacterium]
MRTIDNQFAAATSIWQRLQRDIRLLLRIVNLLFAYLTKGGRIRRIYRDREARGETFWVDEDLKP